MSNDTFQTFAQDVSKLGVEGQSSLNKKNFTPEMTMKNFKDKKKMPFTANNTGYVKNMFSSTRSGISGKKIVSINPQVSKILSQFFLGIIDSHKKVEVRKEVLAEISDFEPMFAYNNMLKYDRTSSIMTSLCIKRFLQSNNVKFEQDLKNFMLYQLNASNPNELPYTEFLRVILPNRRRKLREKVLKKQNSGRPKNAVVESKINFAIAQVFD